LLDCVGSPREQQRATSWGGVAVSREPGSA
jgi:hypothetical protein